ncbi:MAG: putative bifunctional diguanylate cyclase/phosphodiesterase [Acidimicrobiales bacterium]
MTRSFPPTPDRPLDEQLAHLRLLERAAAAANQCADLEEAVALVLAEVCRYTGWPVGHLYVRAVSGDVLLPSPTWYLAGGDPARYAVLRRVTEETPLAAGAGLPGRILATGRPAWIADVLLDANFPRARDHEHDLGVRAAFGFPVLVGEDVVAVLEFFAEEAAEPDEVLLDLMGSVGHQLARIVERNRATVALRQSEERFRAVTESALDAIITADPDGVIVSFNHGAERTFGYLAAEVLGRPLVVLIPPRSQEAHLAGIARLRAGGEPKLVGTTVDLQGVRKDGSEFPVELSLSTWQTSQGRFYTGVLRDVTERRQAEQDRLRYEQQLAQRALHDPLTTLPNRALLSDRLEQAMARAARRGTSVAVLSVNLDRFKAVNDSFGHHIGDELLVAVASRLQAAMGPGDTVARTGGDEFALLHDDVGHPDEAVRLAERVTAAFARSFVVDDVELTVSATIGVAVAVGGGKPAAIGRLLRDAEIARERARQRGTAQIAVYDDSMRSDAAERRTVEQDLRGALKDGRLELHYQPIIDVEAAVVVGVEALVRWPHPDRGLLLPQQFIGLAEDSGLIVPLGRWVLEEACRQAAAWQREGAHAHDLRVSVNVSARQFQQPQWTDEVAHALLTTGLEPGRLVLEITESVLMEDTETTSHRLGELRDLGVRIAIDDFGTGYSSLGYLKRFPVDTLKIDRSFVSGIGRDVEDTAIVRAVITVAKSLGLSVTAEGIETDTQLAELRTLGCDRGQGYLFAKPIAGDSIPDLLAAPPWGRWVAAEPPVYTNGSPAAR